MQHTVQIDSFKGRIQRTGSPHLADAATAELKIRWSFGKTFQTIAHIMCEYEIEDGE